VFHCLPFLCQDFGQTQKTWSDPSQL
jgi:hypothetical protein